MTSHEGTSSASGPLGSQLPCLPLQVEKVRGVNPALLGVRVRRVKASLLINSLLIKPRHSLIYWHHCSALIAVGERCRQLRAVLALKNLGQAQRRPEAETQSKNQGA